MKDVSTKYTLNFLMYYSDGSEVSKQEMNLKKIHKTKRRALNCQKRSQINNKYSKKILSTHTHTLQPLRRQTKIQEGEVCSKQTFINRLYKSCTLSMVIWLNPGSSEQAVRLPNIHYLLQPGVPGTRPGLLVSALHCVAQAWWRHWLADMPKGCHWPAASPLPYGCMCQYSQPCARSAPTLFTPSVPPLCPPSLPTQLHANGNTSPQVSSTSSSHSSPSPCGSSYQPSPYDRRDISLKCHVPQ